MTIYSEDEWRDAHGKAIGILTATLNESTRDKDLHVLMEGHVSDKETALVVAAMALISRRLINMAIKLFSEAGQEITPEQIVQGLVKYDLQNNK